MSNLKKINLLNLNGLLILSSSLALAATPNMPGPYVGVNNVQETTARISFLDNSTDEDGFKVYIHDENDVFDATITPNPIMVPKHDTPDLYQYADVTGLSAESLYKLHVSAFNADGESLKTSPSSVQNGHIKTSPPVCQPAMPGEYVGTYNITNSSARLSFKDNSDNEDGFKAYVYNHATQALVKTIDIDPLSGIGGFQYTNVTGLLNDTLYEVKISAFASGCGESPTTRPSSVNNGRFKTTDIPCPLMPSDYVGTYQVTNNSARISFVDNADNETGFKVYVYDYNSDTLVKTLTTSSVAGVGGYKYLNITGLNANTLYSVKVSAFNAGCQSTKTTPSSVNNGRFTTLP